MELPGRCTTRDLTTERSATEQTDPVKPPVSAAPSTHSLLALFEAVRDGRLAPDEAETRARQVLHTHWTEDLGFARVDHDRAARQGFPEVVFGQGKTPAQVAGIAQAIVARGHTLLVTRTNRETFAELAKVVPDAQFHEEARIIERRAELVAGQGVILIAAAGTSDIPVAEEAAVSAEVMGNTVDRLYDVGVAGLHRLLSASNRLAAARVVIAVAGMEGALASVVGGLVRVPVIAVPTSVGYGANLGGITTLLAMLNSCATGVTVVNVDNGFGAAAAASAINHLA